MGNLRVYKDSTVVVYLYSYVQLCFFLFVKVLEINGKRQSCRKPFTSGEPMATFSLTAAAKEVGKSKPTISKAIKTGRLSANKVGQGYEIDAAELFRVYPKATQSEPAKETTSSNAVNLLKLETKMLREQLDRERETVDDLRQRLDRSELLIADQRPAQPAPRKWFWQRN